MKMTGEFEEGQIYNSMDEFTPNSAMNIDLYVYVFR